MLKKAVCLLFITVLFISVVEAFPKNGLITNWITVSDKTHDHSGIIKIYEEHGKIFGKIVKIFEGGDRNPNGRCEKCPLPFKNKPLVGLTFLWDFIPKTSHSWQKGKILDVKSGRIYEGTLLLSKDEKTLQVRGYWGPFFRTQVWLRKN